MIQYRLVLYKNGNKWGNTIKIEWKKKNVQREKEECENW